MAPDVADEPRRHLGGLRGASQQGHQGSVGPLAPSGPPSGVDEDEGDEEEAQSRCIGRVGFSTPLDYWLPAWRDSLRATSAQKYNKVIWEFENYWLKPFKCFFFFCSA